MALHRRGVGRLPVTVIVDRDLDLWGGNFGAGFGKEEFAFIEVTRGAKHSVVCN